MALGPDDTICFCFHVSLRKVENFCRISRPKVPSQISECLSAGTGCGWCRPMLRRIHADICGRAGSSGNSPESESASVSPDVVNAESYAAGRQQYLATRERDRGKPDQPKE